MSFIEESLQLQITRDVQCMKMMCISVGGGGGGRVPIGLLLIWCRRRQLWQCGNEAMLRPLADTQLDKR